MNEMPHGPLPQPAEDSARAVSEQTVLQSDAPSVEQPFTDAVMLRRHLRRGLICVAIGVFCGASILIGWIVADWDPNYMVSGRRGGGPLWLATIWIAAFGSVLTALGVSQVRAAALFRPTRPATGRRARVQRTR